MFDHALTTLIDTSLILFGVAVVSLLYIANETGYRIGIWRARHRPTHERDLAGIGTITAGMLGLLAFTLGLTINIAQSRFETRRSLVLEEANAIETAWLRTKLITVEEGRGLTALVEDFAKVELIFVSSDSFAAEPGLLARADDLQTRIWQAVGTVTRHDSSSLTAALITALTEMFNAARSERFAFMSEVPTDLSWMLMGGSLIAIGALGYHFGASETRHIVLTALLLVMWAGGMVLIADLNRPRIGVIRVDPSPLVWTIQGFEQNH
jgi:hypothetical protein